MDRKPDKQTLKLLKKHIVFLKRRFHPDKILLFGSRARGDHLEESDIDLIIVSKEFRNLPFRERMIQAYSFWDSAIDLEQICYTPEEFEEMKKRIGIVQQAVNEGIDLLP